MSASELPPELAKELSNPPEHNMHELALAYMEEMGPATIDELLVYFYNVTGKATSRAYLYNLLKRLRDRKLIERVELESEVVVRHMLTAKGERQVKVKGIVFIPTKSVAPDFGDDDE